ncbi:DMT family transporter [Candidatus Peregrinibacteria bacterium]|jgi:drug/metabolite transporter (DMT)-like permease|nr:DMT family transporter [Candidatus Peregrinibacteria bacterium]MBT3598469.1 DMT family transporter [Candidatus Peregrinibacteria bacterium]MBT4367130.1 DMT family transporter [Candidatus Peregrinibacteria bacterium]MBT4585999.1 DMT family transporter [Candidatus Peregrinibacteria bacterium]MBT6730862.1 DMT family transporter [Candidatus Peregrinibacteria bacterium]
MESIVLASLSAICYTTYNVLGRVYSINSNNARAFSVVWGSICTLLLLPLIPFYIKGWNISDAPRYILIALLISVFFYALYDRTQFAVRKYLQASETALLYQISPVASLLTLWLFLGEEPTLIKILAALFILLGNGIALGPTKSNILKRGVILGLFSFSVLGIALAIDKLGSSIIPIPLYAAAVYALPTIFNISVPPMQIKTIIFESKGKLLKILLLAISNVAATLFLYSAFRLGDGGTVLLIVSSSTLLSVLFGIVLLREHNNLYKKGIATIFVSIGLMLLV